jgi:rod shape-determining protein MreD
MDGVFLRRLDVWSRNATPATVAFLVVVLGTLPWPLPAVVPKPSILIMVVVFYWALHRPDLLRASLVFLLGLIQDVLSGGALGLNAFVLLAVYGVVQAQCRSLYGKSFIALWGAFAVIAGGAALVTWLCGSIYYVRLLWPETVIVQYLFNLALYPVMAWCMMRIDMAVLHQE